MNTTSTNSTKGAVIIVFAVFLAVLVIMAAFAIDFARMFSSDAELAYLSERAVTAAMEAALEETSGATEQETFELKVDAAVKRLAEVLELSPNRVIGNWKQALSKGASDTSDVFIPSDYDVDSGHVASEGSFTETAETAVWLEVGTYYWEEPSTCPGTCPCGRSSWEGPCFEPLTFTAGVPDTGTFEFSAIKLRLATTANSRFRSTLANLLGFSDTNLQQSAIAAIPPLFLEFFVDLSRSMQSTNYRPFEIDGVDTAAEYAYKIRDSSPNKCAASADTPGGDHTNPCIPPIECVTPTGCDPACTFPCHTDGSPRFGQIYYCEEPNTRPAPYVPVDTVHYKDDYECFKVDFDGAGGGPPEDYIVSRNIAEPIGGSLQAINFALNTIKNDIKHGRIGATFFTDKTYPIRRFDLSRPGETDYEDLLRITDISDPNTRFERNIRAGIFPEVGAATDYAGALLQLYNDVKDFADAADVHVIVIGDGIPTCRLDGGAPWNPSVKTCDSQNYGIHRSGNTQVAQIIQDLVDVGAKVHTYLIGAHIKPNYAVYKSVDEPDTCMSIQEMKRYDVRMAYGHGDNAVQFLNQSPTAPYMYPNYFWTENAVKLLDDNQLWTVKPPCNPASFTNPKTGSPMTQAECEAGDLEEMMDAACAAHRRRGRRVTIPGVSDEIPGYVTCMPRCLPEAAQLTHYMNEFFKSIVLRLVKE